MNGMRRKPCAVRLCLLPAVLESPDAHCTSGFVYASVQRSLGWARRLVVVTSKSPLTTARQPLLGFGWRLGSHHYGYCYAEDVIGLRPDGALLPH